MNNLQTFTVEGDDSCTLLDYTLVNMYPLSFDYPRCDYPIM